MEYLEIVNLAVAIVLWGPVSVIITQAIKRAGWPTWAKAGVALVCAAVVGVAGSWASGDLLGLWSSWGSLTTAEIIAYAGVVYAAATLWYKTYLGDVQWMERLAAWPGGA